MYRIPIAPSKPYHWRGCIEKCSSFDKLTNVVPPLFSFLICHGDKRLLCSEGRNFRNQIHSLYTHGSKKFKPMSQSKVFLEGKSFHSSHNLLGMKALLPSRTSRAEIVFYYVLALIFFSIAISIPLLKSNYDDVKIDYNVKSENSEKN